jgi:hypothetical protein
MKYLYVFKGSVFTSYTFAVSLIWEKYKAIKKTNTLLLLCVARNCAKVVDLCGVDQYGAVMGVV